MTKAIDDALDLAASVCANFDVQHKQTRFVSPEYVHAVWFICP